MKKNILELVAELLKTESIYIRNRLGKIIRTLPSDFFTYLKGEYLWDI
ncbi:hypothetical protein ONA22_01480 [Mycoplasmopsis cynos]|nr:hypothetical protein [Mycoplasmopsis cynos]WAM03701.1 hypothetical protein ONA22_01480 [Mycoplasmopsis cynos]